MSNDKLIQEAIKQIEQSYGPGTLLAGKNIAGTSVRVISTGSFALNKATGIGGYPRGRIIEIFGPESSGKTTLSLHAIAEAQKAGGRAAFIDAEHALDVKYAESLGINLDELLVAQPDSGEQGLEILESLAKTNAVDLIVVDSVAALVPQSEIDGEISDNSIGAHARMMSKAMRMLTSTISRSNTTVIFINQLREKIGIAYGNPEVTTGGRALKFYASMRIEVRKDSLIKDGAQNIGLKSRVTVVKNKMAAPFGIAHIDMYFGKGFDYSGEIIDFGVNYNIIEKSGTWYSYGNVKLGQGKQQVKKLLDEDHELYAQIERAVVAVLNDTPAPALS